MCNHEKLKDRNLKRAANWHRILKTGLASMVAATVLATSHFANAAAKLPEGDGYLAALINFRYMANAVWTTDEATKYIAGELK